MNRNQPTENDMIYAQAQTIMDFNARMASACFDMCVSNFHIAKLDVQEEICVDRCAFKYFATHQEINGTMKTTMETNALREQMAEAQNAVMGPA